MTNVIVVIGAGSIGQVIARRVSAGKFMTHCCSTTDVCNGGVCCSPLTCADFTPPCGQHSDGCGATLDCACP